MVEKRGFSEYGFPFETHSDNETFGYIVLTNNISAISDLIRQEFESGEINKILQSKT